jgi:outer membrane receptor protein involved in Fe transport
LNFSETRYLATVQESDLQGFTYPVSRNTDWTQPGVGATVALGPWSSLSLDLSAQWAETIYTHDQEGVNVDQSMADHLADTVLLVLRDTTTKKEFLVGSTTANAPLVAWSPWKIHRVDQVWTAQAVLVWRPKRWLSFRASWAWTRNISNVAQYVDGASYERNLIAGSGAVSW